MGEMNDALQASLRAFERSGGRFDYTDPMEMVRDLVVLRRAIPPVRILAADNPPMLGYMGYWNWHDPGGIVAPPPPGDPQAPPGPYTFPRVEEVSVWLQLPLVAMRLWGEGALAEHREVAGHFFTTADGRQALLRFIEEMAEAPVHLDEDGRALLRAARPAPRASEPEPEPEVYIPTRWERMLADDEL